MAFTARVYLFSSPERSEASYGGQIDVTPRPVRNGRTVFTHAAKTKTERVEAVEPPDWETMWDATLFEATLDLLQPGVLKCIAAGLADDRPRRRAHAQADRDFTILLTQPLITNRPLKLLWPEG
jgi:hypothetical protein